MQDMPTERQIEVSVLGALLPPEYGNMTESFLEVWVELIQTRTLLPESARRNVSHHINKTDILFNKVREATSRLTFHLSVPTTACGSISNLDLPYSIPPES